MKGGTTYSHPGSKVWELASTSFSSWSLTDFFPLNSLLSPIFAFYFNSQPTILPLNYYRVLLAASGSAARLIILTYLFLSGHFFCSTTYTGSKIPTLNFNSSAWLSKWSSIFLTLFLHLSNHFPRTHPLIWLNLFHWTQMTCCIQPLPRGFYWT